MSILLLANRKKKKLYPRDVNGCVLSLIAKQANNGQPPLSSTSIWSDRSKARTSYSYSNLFSNGNFANTNDWTTIGGTFAWSVLNNVAIITNLGASASAYKLYAANATTPNYISGHKYYFRAWMKSNSSSDGINASSNLGNITKNHTGSGNWEFLSVVATASADGVDDYRILNTTRTGDISANPIEIKEGMAIDLTALGLETLSLAQCNALFPFTATTATTFPRSNDCLMVNQAGTGASGFNSEVNATTGKTVYFNKLDGTDDYGAMVNAPSLDITTKEMALCATFRLSTGAGDLLLVTLSDGVPFLTAGLLYRGATTKKLNLYLNNTQIVLGDAISENVWYNVIVYRNSTGAISYYINKNSQIPVSNSFVGTINTPVFARIGARVSNSAGTTYVGFFKGDIATESIYVAPTLNIQDIIRKEMYISKDYTGVS